MPPAPVETGQSTLGFESIKQYPGLQTAERRVKVQAPGKFFTGLTANESAAFYEVEAVEFTERHKFAKHLKGWGAAHTGPGIRITCARIPTTRAFGRRSASSTGGVTTRVVAHERWRMSGEMGVGAGYRG